MPKGSEELTNARKEEIINACASLYETMGFKDITIRDIGAKTSFTRTSIYNYFQTKEEIFLALLQREHEAWTADLERTASEHDALSADEFADALRSVSCCLEKFFPRMTVSDIQEFLYAFFPFLFGVYPYTTATDKQKEAMELAHVNYAHYSIYEITRSFVAKMLRGIDGQK